MNYLELLMKNLNNFHKPQIDESFEFEDDATLNTKLMREIEWVMNLKWFGVNFCGIWLSFERDLIIGDEGFMAFFVWRRRSFDGLMNE
jgi:hypothetical protein